MALIVNSNIASINAQRQLVSSGMDLDKASARLASGKRINSAADDAAGLAISNRQTSQIRGLDQAVRNANDGISLIQTAEGALEESTNILQRMRELAIQSANGIFEDKDRATIDAEVQQLVSELDRIAETTSFNGQKLLDGTLGNVDLQVGSEAYQTISFSVGKMDTSSLGLGATTSDLSGARMNHAGTIDIGQGDILINGQAISAITNLQGAAATDTSMNDLIDDINENIAGVTASGFNIIEATTVGDGIVNATGGNSLVLTLAAVDGGVAVAYEITNTANLNELVTAINAKTGGAITAALNDEGKMTLSNTTGGRMTIAENGTALGALGIASTTYDGSLSLESDNGDPITITRGKDGTDTDLTNFGFMTVPSIGGALGGELNTGAQITALNANDLIINGVDIGAVAASAGLAAKIDAINAKSDETGVTASVTAVESYTTQASSTYNEIKISGAIALTSGDTLVINGNIVTFSGSGGATLSAADVVTSINDDEAVTGVRAYLNDDDTITLASESNIIITSGAANGTIAELGSAVTTMTGGAVATSTSIVPATLVGEAGSLKINGTEVDLTNLGDIDQIVTDLNTFAGVTGVNARIDSNGELALSSASTINVEMGQTQGQASAFALGITFTDADTDLRYSDETVSVNPRIELDSANDATISVEVTTNGVTSTGFRNLNTDLGATVTGSAISNISVATQAGAQSAIGAIDQALETINDTRSELGAVNNRLDFTVSNLSSISEKTSAARSRIVDADFAKETANLSRAQVLTQASQAMLAQANSRPQQVLSLLQ